MFNLILNYAIILDNSLEECRIYNQDKEGEV